jgi:hypothetical protein
MERGGRRRMGRGKNNRIGSEERGKMGKGREDRKKQMEMARGKGKEGKREKDRKK